MSKRCIVCDRPVPKRTTTYFFYAPQEAYDGGPFGAKHDARPDGTIIGTAIYLADWPTTKAECQRFTNLQIVSVSRAYQDKGRLGAFTTWDGESYANRGLFCTNRCAMAQGFASAEHGYRFTWPAPSHAS